MNLINPQIVRAGLAEQSALCHEFDGKTRPYPISILFNSHSLERWIDWTGFVAVTLGSLPWETFTSSLSFWTTHESMAVPIRVLWFGSITALVLDGGGCSYVRDETSARLRAIAIAS